MPTTRPAARTPGTPRPDGIISGHLLRLIREHIGHTQEALAEALSVDVDTLKSWETGRRPIPHIKVQTLWAMLRRLRQLGAPERLLDQLHAAIDVDLFIGQILEHGGQRPDQHPLATWVATREWSDLLAWALAGTPPSGLVVPGRDIPRPRLAVPDRGRFFDALRATAEQTMAADGVNARDVLLRRQVYFMAGWDTDPAGRTWLDRMERAELRHLRGTDGWTPTWVAGRSIAVARACQGDRERLRHFIAHQLGDDQREAANLNYWAYWIGETATAATSDDFMAADLGGWRGTDLLRHLTRGLNPAVPYVELSIHSVWSLLQRRPWLLNDDPDLARQLHARINTLLDAPADLSDQARQELNQLHFATRMTRGINR